MPRSIDVDFTIAACRLSVPDGQEYVTQRATQLLRFFNGESFPYPARGIAYY